MPADASIILRPMTIDDYDAVYALWQAADGVGLNESDERPAIARYLERNPGQSTVAVTQDHGGEQIVAAMLCGHNGRRGEFAHLAVAPSYRGRGIGRRVVVHCLRLLADQAIPLCNIYVFSENREGQAFWERLGFAARRDVLFMQGPTDC